MDKPHQTLHSEGFTREEVRRLYHPHWGKGPDGRHYYIGLIPVTLIFGEEKDEEGKKVTVRMQRKCTKCGKVGDLIIDFGLRLCVLYDEDDGTVISASLRDQPQCIDCRGSTDSIEERAVKRK